MYLSVTLSRLNRYTDLDEAWHEGIWILEKRTYDNIHSWSSGLKLIIYDRFVTLYLTDQKLT